MPAIKSASPLPLRTSLAGAYAALVAGAIAMGASPVFVRLADVGPYTSAFWRVALALPLLWIWVRLGERGGKPGPSFVAPTLAAGLAFAGDLFFWHSSIVNTSVANATFFATTAPIWVVGFGWLFWRRKASGNVLAGLAFCLFGGAALVAQSFRIDAARVAGDVFGIATAVFFGLYFLAVKAARSRCGAARVTFELTMVAAAVLLVVAIVLESTFWPRSLAGWGALFGMAWISHAGGQGLLSVALGRLPPVFSSLVIFLEAIAAAAFGWVILNEPVALAQGIGGLVILLGIWVARPKRRDVSAAEGDAGSPTRPRTEFET